MIDPAPTPLFIGANGVGVPMPPAALRAGLAFVGGLGGLVTALLLTMSVAANSGNEAERITDAQDEGYTPTLVAALAVNLSKPLR